MLIRSISDDQKMNTKDVPTMSPTEAVFTFLRDHKGLPIRSMSVFNYVLEAALCGGLLILLVLLVRALLRKRLGNRLICLLWLLVAVRLLVPLALPNPLMNELRPTYSADGAARPIADQFRVRYQDAMIGLSDLLQGEDEYYVTGKTYTPGQLAFDLGKYTNYGWLGKWYLFAYLAGCGITLICLTARGFTKGRLKRRGDARGNAWEAARVLCCAVQWFNPLVWMAARLSRRDEELAKNAASEAARPSKTMTIAVTALGCAALLCSYCVAESPNPYAGITTPYQVYPNGEGEAPVVVDRAVVERYACDEMLSLLGFSQEDIDAGAFDIELERDRGLWRALFTIRKENATNAARAYLDRWFPGMESCTLVWGYADYNARTFFGRVGSWRSERGKSGEVDRAEAMELALAAIRAHYGLDASVALKVNDLNFAESDPYWAEHGHPDAYWRAYVYEERDNSPCRVVHLDAATGEAWLFLDEVSNG